MENGGVMKFYTAWIRTGFSIVAYMMGYRALCAINLICVVVQYVLKN